MDASTIVAVLTGVLGGAIVTGAVTLMTERARRQHDLAVRDADREAERTAALRARRVDIYQRAVTRLRSTHAALNRAVGTIGADDRGVDHPFSTRGSADWAIDEADQLRTVQADVDLFGSAEVAATFATALECAENVRYALGISVLEWDQADADRTVTRFDEAFQQVLTRMRSELGT